jgi:hypothetical protein
MIADKIYPLLKNKTGFRFRMLICGKNLPENIKEKLTDKKEITYCGFVDDIETYIDAADMMINPILSGGGVKTKAIDTLARNRQVISTRTGAEGIDPTVCGNKLQVVPDHDWEAFVNSILTHQTDSGKIPDAFYETYSWTGIIDTLSQRMAQLR